MVTVKYEDLSLAFDFVSSGAPMEHQAYISMDTGKIYWVSELAPTEDELPDDLEESDRYPEWRPSLDIAERIGDSRTT